MSDQNDKADEAVEAVIDELDSRRGFDHFWERIDSDIQENIKDSLADRIRTVYSDTNEDA